MRALVAAEMRVKHALASPRPVEYSPQVMPMIQTPGHSSFPSGHAVEAFMLAHVLAELIETAAPNELVTTSVISGDSAPASLRGQLMWLAARIATNRVVAGVHFPVDNAAGMVLGSLLGRYFVALATGKPATGKKRSLESWTFDATRYGADDFRWRDMLRALENGETSLAPESGEAAFLMKGDDFELKPLPSESPVRWLWDRAVEEWQKPL